VDRSAAKVGQVLAADHDRLRFMVCLRFSIIRNEGLRLGHWTRDRDGDDLEGKGFEAMQAAVKCGLPLPGEPAA
jgi:hypothetical protein